MLVFQDSTTELPAWVRREVEFEREISSGSRGSSVKRVQEWLNLHGFGIAIDSVFGPVTASAVERFQEATGLGASGSVDEATFDALVGPLRSVLVQRSAASVTVGQTVLEYARVHLDQSPREVGGQNRGPWVRLYVGGHDGAEWAWCAGFVTFVLKQAVDSLRAVMPIEGSVSCDTLAAQAKASGRFLAESDLVSGDLPDGAIFLVRRTVTDWTHTGIVTSSDDRAFETIEGNTNDNGSREGYEVCARSRGFVKKDFITLD